MPTLITVAIPAYNQPEDLAVILPTVPSQRFNALNPHLVEAKAPKQVEIRQPIARLARRFPDDRAITTALDATRGDL
jgi:hypothetical protein